MLLDAGACGAAVHDQLLFAVQDQHEDAIVLLRSKGASLNRNDGKALIEAIKYEYVDTLRLLLDGTVSVDALAKAFPYLRHKGSDLQMMKMLLEAGASGYAVHAALRNAIFDGHLHLIDPLLSAHADPTFDDAQALRQAVVSCDAGVLRKLLYAPAEVPPSHVSSLLPGILRLAKERTRFQMVELVIERNASRNSISAALVHELSRSNTSFDVVSLLVSRGNADIDHDSGKALILATRDPKLLDLLMSSLSVGQWSLRSALVSSRKSPFSDEAKAMRSSILLGGTGNGDLAHDGIKAYIEHCRAAFSNELWPLEAFKVLIDTRPDLSVNGGDILTSAIQAGALHLIELLLPTTLQATIDKALAESLRVHHKRPSLYQILLQARPSNPGLSAALIVACQRNLAEIAQELLMNGASLEFLDHGAIRYAALDLHLLDTLLTTKPSQASLAAAFDVAITLEDADHRFKSLAAILAAGNRSQALSQYLVALIDQDNTELRFVQLLLDYGESVEANDSKSVMLAATKRKLEVLKLLWTHVRSSETAKSCSEKCVSAGLIQTHEIEIMRFLLDMGAKGPSIDDALQVAVENAINQDTRMVVLLFLYGADANASTGKSICHACQTGQLGLVELLVQSSSDVGNRARGFLSLIKSDPATVSTTDFCSIVDVLIQPQVWDGAAQIRSHLAGILDSLIRDLLRRRPKGLAEVRTVLATGINLLSTDLLFWTMGTSPRIKTDCIELLVKHGADARYVANSETTIMLAICTGRDKLIKTLIAYGADLSSKDTHGRSALLLAVEKGSLISDLVLGPPDDGSLHQAVRKLQPNVVRLLLEHGHGPMLPSPFPGHGRRTPLAELMSIATDASKYHAVQQIIEELVEKGADITKSFAGKPLICLALDNSANAAEALLPVIHWCVDEDFNLYTNEAYCYSPTTYLLKGLCAGPPNEIHSKRALLRQYGAEREVFYALKGPQFEDAVGMPPEIARLEIERKAKLRREAEQEAIHLAEIRRTEDLAAMQDRIAEQQHQQVTQRRVAMEAQSMQLLQEKHRMQIGLDREKWDAEEEQELKKELWRQNERRQLQAHRESLFDLEMRKKGQGYVLEQQHRAQLLWQNHRAMQERVKVQKSLAEDQDMYAGRRHERRVQEIGMEKALPIGWENWEALDSPDQQRFIEL